MTSKVCNKKRKLTRLVIRSIFSFLLFYLLSFIVGGGILLLTLWLIFASEIRAKYEIPYIAVVILFCGSVFLLYQMIRSVFQFNKKEFEGLKELSRNDMPELFDIIDDVAAFMKTTVPQKVYLSSSVSASVFLNTSSTLFFSPSKKKLEIGVGLINLLTMEELKAVIAHEMGHFSQRSMFLGGYVFSIEQVVYYISKQVDFKKKGIWEQQVKGLFGIFYVFAHLIFRKLNRQFKDFSLELEYDADRLAMECVGTSALKSALMKISFASVIYEDMITILGNWAIHGKCVPDIYTAHRYSMDACLSVFDNGTRFTESLWSKPVNYAMLSPVIRCRLERLSNSILAENSNCRLTREYIPILKIHCSLFTKQIYSEIYRKNFEDLDECSLFTYHKWINAYYLWLSHKKNEERVNTLHINMQAKLHKLPLVDVRLDVYLNKMQIGEGSFKKGISVSVPITVGKHSISIICWTECCMNEVIDIKDEDSKMTLNLDYRVELWKGRYIFLIKRQEMHK